LKRKFNLQDDKLHVTHMSQSKNAACKGCVSSGAHNSQLTETVLM